MCQYGQGRWDLGQSSTQGPESAAGKETDLFQSMFCVQHTMCMDQEHSKLRLYFKDAHDQVIYQHGGAFSA